MKILTVLGARPQFIKASVVSHFISTLPAVQEVVVHTGQHFDSNMSDVFFDELGMKTPAYQLDIHGGGHGDMTGRMLIEVEKVLLQERPDVVLVYGDTNSTLAGALAAVKLHIPVAHVEAGLRSFNMAMPEEVNRILTDRVSRWMFTPTATAAKHLKEEGVGAASIIPVGDVMYDVAKFHGGRVDSSGRVMAKLGLKEADFVLATVHRAENTDDPSRLTAIVEAFRDLSTDLPIVWPVHPRTRAVLQKRGQLDDMPENLHLIDPVGYLDMVQLEKHAALIATDSGGVQKEAFFYGVPCVTLRDETEWVELVEAGWNRLVSPKSSQEVATAVRQALGSKGETVQPYGQGNAAELIICRLVEDLAE
ncbi:MULTISPECIES: non-hydrolyzing UDP-N-acetylglucosamine 2-epimerase [Pseudomonas]|jgi:UDP-GlcNAc3NAcA epimerase|uniref:UDP-GlcNAc3NAcA epimerase n=1 Tax=Pseudomonas mediterranea TaxID=183795 RepID=A0AAX2DH24_9PSED|nr:MULTISPECIES: UDP-N-acetylglucosamine 2-epimerase (non-hydrolyzing) [Pseudomonas]KGU84304.1 UDP-N-acetylglucosamine 2-epimerase [Pseudomonas mediterranea CFBP 5447]MBL0843393.1 UDP-N-acetylglucosamine 2-epimerase (non-hydrolyzing) [Pseudomonas mediterranea]UZE02639.1 UDP-N-acetylglucosamine 2-epimerase (non-hydrolyzing) [Pseudomonas mediterranea]UZE25375.1 UDP-N-acetylglucosamine 2-epimerase (non-hydrolyzing) [Pseudomonas sp. B21-056]CAH0229109.1 UDP-2,3-diacetamido-2,3-dideoxy-D-glucuronat